jgi:hypothetical protein
MGAETVMAAITTVGVPSEMFQVMFRAGLFNAAPVVYFSGALIYSDVNQNFKKKIFLNNSRFQFFS